MGLNVRQQAIKSIAAARNDLCRIDFRKTRLKDYFGVNVFNDEVQRSRLPKSIYNALQRTIRLGEPH